MPFWPICSSGWPIRAETASKPPCGRPGTSPANSAMTPRVGAGMAVIDCAAMATWRLKQLPLAAVGETRGTPVSVWILVATRQLEKAS